MSERTAVLEVFKRASILKDAPEKATKRFFYWRLRAGNGAIIADGAEGYTRKGDAEKAAKRAKELMAEAAMEVLA